jgi:hypothetical protein
MHFLATTEAPASDNLDRGRFRDHYTNDVSVFTIIVHIYLY